MPKKVKTRKQKILADSRRKANPTVEKKVDTATYSIPQQKQSATPGQSIYAKSNLQTTIATSSYSYLSGDLRRTVFLTLAIVIAELLIRFTVKGI